MSENQKDQVISILENELNISSDQIDAFKQYEALLHKWQKAQNLVSRETLDHFWIRHILDCAQIKKLVPENGIWLDLGSGAGLPGLVTAILQKQNDKTGHIHLVESNGRKVAFMRTVIRECELQATVHNSRIESVSKQLSSSVDFLSARALAPLKTLLEMAKPYCDQGARCFFHKGRDIDEEAREAANIWDFDLIKYNHIFSQGAISDGKIVMISRIERKD